VERAVKKQHASDNNPRTSKRFIRGNSSTILMGFRKRTSLITAMPTGIRKSPDNNRLV
jgi:hypothetical protein